METVFDPQAITAALAAAEEWVLRHLLVFANLAQLVVVALAFVPARLAAPRVQGWMENLSRRRTFAAYARQVAAALAPLTKPFVWLVLLWLAVLVAGYAGWPHQLIRVVVSLLTAWVIIRLASSVVRDPTWSGVIAAAAWTIAALNILGLLGPTIALLDSLALTLGELRVSALSVIKGMIVLAVLLWGAIAVSRVLERRISQLPNLTPSIQVLLAKLLKTVLILVAVVAALSSVGIDLTAFAVFSGALGVGLGFGLQKVVSNLVSGVILLLDKSIKPGDVIVIGDTYGWIKSLGARYASVITRDGTEHLIPNEELITQRVENWSYSNDLVRLRVPVGISYKSDVRKAIEVCVQAADESLRVLKAPSPICLLTGFGDSSVDLELRFWINDPPNGLSNVKSDILLRIWDGFHAHGIEIPYPQRDLHLKPPAEVQVVATAAAPAPAESPAAGP
jgi:small-conductance mechanosensitive channel